MTTKTELIENIIGRIGRIERQMEDERETQERRLKLMDLTPIGDEMYLKIEREDLRFRFEATAKKLALIIGDLDKLAQELK